MRTDFKRVIRAENDILFNEDGTHQIDMFGANGTVLLGHANPSINKVMHEQLDQIWSSGLLETPVRGRARELVESYFPSTHGLAVFYSTGMEAVEFAIRACRVTTGRKDLIGFESSMHGKSMATAYLAWENPFGYQLPGFHRLPFPKPDTEADTLERIGDLLKGRNVAAVFVEPIQGSGGGYEASTEFYQQLYALCRQYETLLLFDEILAGFYRTGTAFYHTKLGFTPDVVTLGKIMGNGFPVSGVIMDRRYPIQPTMLPGSTYAGNPLATAAVVGTMDTLAGMDIEDKTARIEQAVKARMGELSAEGFIMRGCGALWVFHFSQPEQAYEVAMAAYKRGVFVSQAGSLIRLMPAATIEPDNLSTALNVVAEEIERRFTVSAV